MRISLRAQGRVDTQARRIGFGLLGILVMAAVAGCGARQTEQARTDSGSRAESSQMATATQATAGQAGTGSEVEAGPGLQRRAKAGSQGQPSAGSRTQHEGLDQATTFAVPHREMYPYPDPVIEQMHRIVLTEDGCVRFEPQWSTVRLGQSIAWHSDLKKPIRIYVSPGVFTSLSFVVKPGHTVTTGPALASGRYSFWTEPSACREAPRGVLLSGPGVMVEESFYASLPGIH